MDYQNKDKEAKKKARKDKRAYIWKHAEGQKAANRNDTRTS